MCISYLAASYQKLLSAAHLLIHLLCNLSLYLAQNWIIFSSNNRHFRVKRLCYWDYTVFNGEFRTAAQGVVARLWHPGEWKMSSSQFSFKSSHTNRRKRKKKNHRIKEGVIELRCHHRPLGLVAASVLHQHAFRAPPKGSYSLHVEDGDSDNSLHGCVLPQLKLG